MYSVIPIEVPKQIDENTSFTEIMGEILIEYAKEEIEKSKEARLSTNYIASFSHAKLFSHACDFFKERTKKGASPVKILENALQGSDALIPGCSFLSTPFEKMLYPSYGGRLEYAVEQEKNRIIFNKYAGVITQDSEAFMLSSDNFQRGFAQVLTGGLEASIEMGLEDVFRVPSFANRAPNYFDEVVLNNVGEGLERGTLIVEGPVGDYLGKHSNGGTIVVTGKVGKMAGDVSRNVIFYLGNDVGSITQASGDRFYIKGNLRGKFQGEYSLVGLGGMWMPGRGTYSFEQKERMKENLGKDNLELTECDETVAEEYDRFLDEIYSKSF